MTNTVRRLIILFLTASNAALHAQSASGNINGQMTDPSGLGIPGVRVAATNMATNVATAATTNEAGSYNLVVPPGTYRLTGQVSGFKQFLQNNVIVTASASVRVDAVLEVGAVTESVEVQGRVQTVQTDNAKITTAVENKFVDELPLVVGGALRNPYDLVQISAQVMTTGNTEMALGGAQARSWNATLDGLSITTNRSAEKFEVAYAAPSVEAITEFAVDTNGFKAEYGQSSGGIITFSSRSGTNAFHGTAYDFLRNQALDARAFFERQKSIYKQNDFGAAAGGPIRIPKLYDGKNRTFFYLTYEGFRNRIGGQPIIQSVPTPEMYNGDFSRWVNQRNQPLAIYDPATTRPNPAGGGFVRDPFAANQIPTARFSTLSKTVMPYAQGVRPNRGGAPGTSDYVRNNWINTGGSIQSPQDKGSAKVDHLLTANHRLGYFYNITRARDIVGADGPPGLPPPLYGNLFFKWDISSHRLNYDWVISSTTFNQVNVGGNLFWRVQDSLNYGLGWKNKVCFPNVIDCDINFPSISFTEFNSWGGSARSGLEAPMWAIKDDLSHTHGKHTLKFGFSYQKQKSSGTGEQNIAGQATFSYLGTSIPGDPSFQSGGSFASFLLGDAQAGATESRRDNTFIYPYYGFYAQDDWRIARRLTLNLGIRYDLSPAPVIDNDWHSDFDPLRPNAAINNYPGALRFGGFGPGRENSRTLVDGWYKGVGPRVGLAYAVGDKMTIRAAFGRSFGRVLPFRDSGHYQGFIGRYNFSSSDQGITPAFNWDKGLPPYPLPLTLDPNAKLDPAFANNDEIHYYNGYDATRAPESLYWTLGVQREIARNTVFEATYAANIGTRLDTSLLNFNQVPTSIWNQYVARLGATGARNLLLLPDINSAAARQAGVPIPYANFTNPNVQTNRSVGQALRPFPQFLWVVTGVRGNGDRSGHSSYHALVLKLSRRYHNGLTFEWNYTLSKVMTDADNQVAGNGTTQDHYNRRLEKSIGGFDQTHNVKISTVYELPFGKGRRYLASSGGLVNTVLGGWRVAGIQVYASGFPIRLTRNNPLPIFNGDTRPTITSYDNWRAPVKGEQFDPAVDRFLNIAAFPAQPVDFGNVTRFTPKVRSFPVFNENISMAKTFAFKEKFSVNLRWEAFNLFNRVLFGTGPTNLNSATFGVVTTQTNDPRRMQVGLKLYW